MNLNPFTSGSETASDTESGDADPEADSEVSAANAPIPRDFSDFAVPDGDTESHYSNSGEELLVSHDGDAYAGEWVREMFENAGVNPEQPTWLGYQEGRNPLEPPREVGLPADQLNTHLGVFGASGYGKSTLLLNMMTQWAYAGQGFLFVDPKGQDCYELMQQLPEHRKDDVIWIEPSSVDFDKVVGLNFLHTHTTPDQKAAHDNEVQQVIDDLIPILEGDHEFGARMKSILENTVRRMLNDETNYTIIDLYVMLSDPTYREELPEYYDDPVLKQMAQTIAGYEQDDVAPLLRRFQTLVESQATREVIGHRDSDVDLREAVEEDKIIILRTAEAGDSVQRLVATTVMRRLWSAIASRNSGDDVSTFGMVVDELHKVMSGSNNIEDMLRTGRSLGLSMTLATQQPSQLGELKTELSNVKTLISMATGESDDARFVAERLGMESHQPLLKMPQYTAMSRVSYEEGSETEPIKMRTFAPYPPLRTRVEAKEMVRDIVDRYGKEPMFSDDLEMKHHPLKDNDPVDDTESDESDEDVTLYVVSDNGDEMTEQQVLECIFDAQLKADGRDAHVSRDAVETEMERRLGHSLDSYGAKDANVFEQLSDSLVDKALTSGGFGIKLTAEGRDRVFDTNSGESASAGKVAHRTMLEETYLAFTRLGYDVDIPEQEGRMPDGLAKPRHNPETADSFKEAKQREEKLMDNYSRLYELFEADELSIEAEKATLTKPKQVFHNLEKALEQQRRCVYVVLDGAVDDKPFTENAEKIENWLSSSLMSRDITDGNRMFYNSSQKIEFPQGWYAAKPDDGRTVWKEDGEKLVLENPNGHEPFVETTIDEMETPKRSAFPYVYKYDASKQRVVVEHGNGKQTDAYDEYHDVEEMMEDGLKPVYRPYIPEIELPKYPVDNDDWDVVIIPTDERDCGPQLYRDGECIDIFEGDEVGESATVTLSDDADDADADESQDDEEWEPTDEAIQDLIDNPVSVDRDESEDAESDVSGEASSDDPSDADEAEAESAESQQAPDVRGAEMFEKKNAADAARNDSSEEDDHNPSDGDEDARTEQEGANSSREQESDAIADETGEPEGAESDESEQFDDGGFQDGYDETLAKINGEASDDGEDDDDEGDDEETDEDEDGEQSDTEKVNELRDNLFD